MGRDDSTMIYLFYGSDVEKVRAKAFAWVAAARAKEPNLAYQRLSREELSAEALDDVVVSGSLFAKRTLTLIDDPFPRAVKSDDGEDEESAASSVLEDKLELLADSDNVIVILAPKLLAAKAKKLVAKAKLEYKFELPVARADARGFNSALVNALAQKNGAKLWLEITRALKAGDAPEMIHGLLHWKARDLADRTLSLSLISLLQESRRGGGDLSASLERFALSI